MLTELRCPLECKILSKDTKGHTFAIIDYGPEADLIFVVVTLEGQVWCVSNKDIRIVANWTLGRNYEVKNG